MEFFPYQASRSYPICGALHDLVPFVQFKKREKHPWRSFEFSKVAGLKPATLLKLTLHHGCFSRFSNCKNGIKSPNASDLALFFQVYDVRLLFLCIYIFYISILAPAGVFLLSLGNRDSKAKYQCFAISHIYKCYLTTIARQLTTPGISLSSRVFEFASMKFFVYCFLFISFMFLRYSLSKL